MKGVAKPSPLYLLDSDGGNPRPLATTAGTINYAPRWSSQGKALVYAGQQGKRSHLYLVRLPDGKPKQLTAGDWDDIQPDIWGDPPE